MKLKMICLLSIFVLGTMGVFAGNKTEKFKVYGNCGMCEKRIEKAAKAIDGVASADWNKGTKMMEVTFDETKTDLDKIQQAIAKAGHDTEGFEADAKTYDALPDCCHYDRKEVQEVKKVEPPHQH
ncbi:MAG: cation transporter [Bacteroidetes bacterium]|nr:cation transporter [Bacteroidota bacterium]